MYLYFDKTGKLKEIINDEALRQGNFGINKIYIYVEDRTYLSADVSYLLPSGLIVGPVNYDTFTNPTATEINENCYIPFDSKRDLRYFKYYKPYKFLIVNLEADLNDNGPLDEAGVVHCNININLVNDAILQLGELNFNVEVDSTLNTHYVASEEYLSLSNYLFLRSLYNNFTIADVVEDENEHAVSSTAVYNKLLDYQPTLIAGNNIAINDNVISVYDVEGLIAYVDLSDSENEITQEQIDLLNENKLNYILVDGVRYNYAQENEYVYVDDTQVSKITIDASELTWSEDSLNLVNVQYSSTDLSSYLTTDIVAGTNIRKAKMIVDGHQLIFEIKIRGQSNSKKVGRFFTNNILIGPSLANKLTRFNGHKVSDVITTGSTIVGYGRFNQYFNGTYTQGNIQLISPTAFYLNVYSPDDEGETYIEKQSIHIDIRIVIDI